MNIDWKQLRATEQDSVLQTIDLLEFSYSLSQADSGEHAFTKCQAIVRHLRRVGALVPDDALPLEGLARGLTCLEKPGAIAWADLESVVAAPSVIFNSAERGDFSALNQAVCGWQRRTLGRAPTSHLPSHPLRVHFYQYDGFVSYRNVSADHAVARELALELTARAYECSSRPEVSGWRTCWTPKGLGRRSG